MKYRLNVWDVVKGYPFQQFSISILFAKYTLVCLYQEMKNHHNLQLLCCLI